MATVRTLTAHQTGNIEGGNLPYTIKLPDQSTTNGRDPTGARNISDTAIAVTFAPVVAGQNFWDPDTETTSTTLVLTLQPGEEGLFVFLATRGWIQFQTAGGAGVDNLSNIGTGVKVFKRLTVGVAELRTFLIDALNSSELTWTEGTNEITLKLDNLALARLAPATRGDIIIYDSAAEPVVLSIGAAAKYLRSDGVDPGYSTVQFTELGGSISIGQVVDDFITLAKLTHQTRGDLLTYDFIGGATTVSIGADNTFLHSNGLEIDWSTVNFTHLSGSIAIGQVPDDFITLAEWAHGAKGNMVYFNQSNAPTMLTIGTANQYLRSDGLDPLWGTIDFTHLGGSIAIGQVPDNLITLAKMAHATRGDLIVYDATSAPALVNIGANKKYWRSDGTDPSWSGLVINDDPAPKLAADLNLNAFHLKDSGGDFLFKFFGVGSAVNWVETTNSKTGAVVNIRPGGSDTDVQLNISGKGTGLIFFGGDVGIGSGDKIDGVDVSEIQLGDLAKVTGDKSEVRGLFGKLFVSGMSAPSTGEIMYYDGTNWAKLAAGTEGQVLTAHGAGAPTWET